MRSHATREINMKIAIIGSGNIGGTLGRHWAHVGHEVMFSSRNPKKLEPMAKEVGAKTGTIKEAAAFGDVVLLAIPFGRVAEVAQQVGRLDNKILIDATESREGLRPPSKAGRRGKRGKRFP